MKIKNGIDIIEVERIQNSIEEFGENFLNRVFTKNEINYCKDTKKLMYQHYAARFAAKEAAFKAISDLLNNKYGITWQNIEIIVKEGGKPEIKFINLSEELGAQLSKIQSIDLSISHIEKLAVATVSVLIED